MFTLGTDYLVLLKILVPNRKEEDVAKEVLEKRENLRELLSLRQKEFCLFKSFLADCD